MESFIGRSNREVKLKRTFYNPRNYSNAWEVKIHCQIIDNANELIKTVITENLAPFTNIHMISLSCDLKFKGIFVCVVGYSSREILSVYFLSMEGLLFFF